MSGRRFSQLSHPENNQWSQCSIGIQLASSFYSFCICSQGVGLCKCSAQLSQSLSKTASLGLQHLHFNVLKNMAGEAVMQFFLLTDSVICKCKFCKFWVSGTILQCLTAIVDRVVRQTMYWRYWNVVKVWSPL